MNSRARWAADALDLTDDIETASTYLTIGQVSDATGLAHHTIADPLTRQEITREDNPRGALCRPAARIGDVPLWDPSQVAEFLRRQKARVEREDETLPLVSTDEATSRNLGSTREVAELFDVHDQTVRRWERNEDDYPPKVAKRSRDGRSGPPEHVRDLRAVVEWAENKGIKVPGAHTAVAASV